MEPKLFSPIPKTGIKLINNKKHTCVFSIFAIISLSYVFQFIKFILKDIKNLKIIFLKIKIYQQFFYLYTITVS